MNPTARLKLVCQSVTAEKDQYSAKFYAVHSGSEENKRFFKYTPSATLDIQTMNKQQFEPGKEYFVDISLAVEAAV